MSRGIVNSVYSDPASSSAAAATPSSRHSVAPASRVIAVASGLASIEPGPGARSQRFKTMLHSATSLWARGFVAPGAAHARPAPPAEARRAAAVPRQRRRLRGGALAAATASEDVDEAFCLPAFVTAGESLRRQSRRRAACPGAVQASCAAAATADAWRHVRPLPSADNKRSPCFTVLDVEVGDYPGGVMASLQLGWSKGGGLFGCMPGVRRARTPARCATLLPQPPARPQACCA